MNKQQIDLIRIEALLYATQLAIAEALNTPGYAPGLSILMLETSAAQNRAQYLIKACEGQSENK